MGSFPKRGPWDSLVCLLLQSQLSLFQGSVSCSRICEKALYKETPTRASRLDVDVWDWSHTGMLLGAPEPDALTVASLQKRSSALRVARLGDISGLSSPRPATHCGAWEPVTGSRA